MNHLVSRTRRLTGRATCLFLATLLAVPAAGCLPLPAEPQTPAEPAPECAQLKPAAKRNSCLKKAFERADRELNAVYKRVRAGLPKTMRGDLKENSRDWIGLKEYNCEFQAEFLHNATPDARRTEYLLCLLAYTTERTDYIKRAFGREGVSAATAGSYDDGFSGLLEFEATKNKNEYSFEIAVVRGPTAHVGEISGRVRVNGENAVFAERPECGDPLAPDATAEVKNIISDEPAASPPAEPCCRLDFRLRNQNGFRTIAVKETNCGYYHGARAYFDGLYRKVK